jgi:hypothetical protein
MSMSMSMSIASAQVITQVMTDSVAMMLLTNLKREVKQQEAPVLHSRYTVDR